jgi:hypothetical protein
VHAVRDEALAPDRERRGVVVVLAGRADDPGRVVVDVPARERPGLFALHEEPPPREMAHVGVEEALGEVGVEIAAFLRNEVRAPVERS